MRVRALTWGLVMALCALPLLAQNIPAGDDVWDTLGGGSTNTILLSADWNALCGVDVADTTVQLKGYNLAGYGTGDTVVTRLADADFSGGNVATVAIQLKALQFVNDGSHPCSPLTLWVHQYGTQTRGSMTITRNDSSGGTFSASVPVSIIIEAKNGSTVVGSIKASGVFDDTTASPWSYNPPTGGTGGKAWYPGVDPSTGQPSTTCRFGKETAPSTHCYQYPPKCPTKQVLGNAQAKATAIAVEPCTVAVAQ